MGDISDNAYMAEAMSSVDYVVYVPSPPRAFDCEVAPAECTVTFLETVTGVIHTATDCGVKKLLVVSPNTSFILPHPSSISKMPALLAALIQNVVVAEARYQGPDAATTICFTPLDADLKLETRNLKLIGFAFDTAVNGDVIIRQDDSFERIPCENFEMRR